MSMRFRSTPVLLLAIGLLAWLGFAVLTRAQQPVEVDVELVLAVDVSRSMNREELLIQREGYAAALTDPQVINAITQGLTGRIAVTYLEWAGDGTHHVTVPWRIIANEEDAGQFAAVLRETPVWNMQFTSISGAILKATQLFENNNIAGLKRVIDVSGDGPNNQGVPVTEARDLAAGSGITINGLPLMTAPDAYSRWSIPDLDVYYIECVIGGPGSFSLPVRSWEEFPAAVRRKLVLELAGGLPDQPARLIPASARTDSGYDCLIGEKLRRQMMEIYRDP